MIPVGGKLIKGPEGVIVQSFMEDSKLRLGPTDRRARKTKWVRSVILHTTWGVPSVVEPGVGPNLGADYSLVSFYNHEAKSNGAHIGVDTDGSVGIYADLLNEVTYHATSINEVSIGLEIKQVPIKDKNGNVIGGRIWQVQLENAARLVDTICRAVGIQRQYHAPYTGMVPRLASGGLDCVGVFGHRDQTSRKGPGDPGNEIFECLRGLKFDQFNYNKQHDIHVWLDRQKALRDSTNMSVVIDGIPGPATVSLLKSAGYPDGIWNWKTK